MKKITAKFVLLAAVFSFSFAEDIKTLYSSSTIDWTANTFSSSIMLDMEKAGIKMPAGKQTAVHKIDTNIPFLTKDPLLTVLVDSNQQLSDLVLDHTLSLEDITETVENGKKTPGVFINNTSTLKTVHTLDLLKLSSLLIRHKYPYKNPKPIEQIASRPYTGIIIDARGKLPVQGEFISEEAFPCFFPKIWDEKMNLIYERNMGNPELESRQGMIHYDWTDDETKYQERIGIDPLHINAKKVYGRFRTDPVISRDDALKILTVPENFELLKKGKVVILLDKEQLIAPVSSPEKGIEYYAAFKKIKEHLFSNQEAPVITDTIRGIQIQYDLKFEPDSPKLLDSEFPKIKTLAESLAKINIDNAFTILVEGHTADVNKPDGQMKLSIARTQTIINELVKNGLDRKLFSYRGYGGTQPVASNETPEGRAQNRRVIITARPRATYIQRN